MVSALRLRRGHLSTAAVSIVTGIVAIAVLIGVPASAASAPTASALTAAVSTAAVSNQDGAAVTAWWPVPTAWCYYNVTAPAGLYERSGPGLSWPTVRAFPYLSIVLAGRDGTTSADGYTWRRLADSLGADGYGGFSASVYLTRNYNLGCL